MKLLMLGKASGGSLGALAKKVLPTIGLHASLSRGPDSADDPSSARSPHISIAWAAAVNCDLRIHMHNDSLAL